MAQGRWFQGDVVCGIGRSPISTVCMAAGRARPNSLQVRVLLLHSESASCGETNSCAVFRRKQTAAQKCTGSCEFCRQHPALKQLRSLGLASHSLVTWLQAHTTVRCSCQLTVVCAGSVLGLLFAIITLKLSLGSAGIIPGLGIPAGLISFAVVRSWTVLGSSLRVNKHAPTLYKLLFHPFTVQENAVLQTFITSISGVAFTGGFGTYLTGKWL